MKKALIALCMGGAVLAIATPVLAQSYYDEASASSQRESSIRDRIADGLNHGDLSYDQAGQLRAELRQIVNLDARYQDEGMADWQSHDINSRLSLLDSRLNYDLSISRGNDQDSGY